MRLEAALEGKPNHERHVENMIKYADAIAEAAAQQAMAQIKQELPLLVQQELAKEQNRPKPPDPKSEKPEDVRGKFGLPTILMLPWTISRSICDVATGHTHFSLV